MNKMINTLRLLALASMLGVLTVIAVSSRPDQAVGSPPRAPAPTIQWEPCSFGGQPGSPMRWYRTTGLGNGAAPDITCWPLPEGG